MRNLFYLFIVTFVFVGCKSTSKEDAVYLFTSFREPDNKGLFLAYSEDGYHWEDLGGIYLSAGIGTHGVMRDPSVAKGPDGYYHVVWTTSWHSDNGFGYARTKDFLKWTEPIHLPVMVHEPEVVNVWAPEIFYDDEADRFIIVWASTIPLRFARGVEAEDNNHRLYYVTTSDFENFSETRLFLDPGYSVIDAVIVKRASDDYVLVLKNNTRPERNISVAFGSSPLGPWDNYSGPLTEYLSEGPTVLQLGKEWLIYYDYYENDSYSALWTKDFIDFNNVSEQVSLPEGHKHGTITTISRSVLEGLIEHGPLQ
jgi:hypothetical protein